MNKTSLTWAEYEKYGNYSPQTILRRFGSWGKAKEMAGMKAKVNRNITYEEIFKELERVWILLGRQPSSVDIKKGISKISLRTYERRFGGWSNALQAFVDYINKEPDEVDSKNLSDNAQVFDNKNENAHKHTTKRDINLRLRFRVMQRDNFKCCMCGASPAKDPNVELHIDHIVPWSKGGETTIDNLQTLCSKCNLGKSDLSM